MPLTSRKATLDLLDKITRLGRTLDEVEADILQALSPQDAGLAKAITLTVLKNFGALDFGLKHLMKKPFKPTSKENLILKIGLAQLLYMDGVPDHAAVHATVELAKLKVGRFSGVINGVLREVQRSGFPQTEDDTINIPTWIMERIKGDYKDKAADIARGMLSPAEQYIRLRDETLIPQYEGIATLLSTAPSLWQITDKTIRAEDLPGWDEGGVYIQNASSQLPAIALASALKVEGDVLDMCAAPGGKTIQLHDLLPNCHIYSADMKAGRLKRVEENLIRCKAKATVVEMDGTAPHFKAGTFTGILLDAPCSATGTTRRHPDVLFSRKPEDIAELVTLQDNLLNAMAPLLQDEGVLVYSTCSLFTTEGEKRIKAFLKNHPEFTRLPITAEEVGEDASLITELGDLRPTPDTGWDGFYVARLIKQP
jgi:16S rRNA (cytosine967-C5)-methyltransferase